MKYRTIVNGVYRGYYTRRELLDAANLIRDYSPTDTKIVMEVFIGGEWINWWDVD